MTIRRGHDLSLGKVLVYSPYQICSISLPEGSEISIKSEVNREINPCQRAISSLFWLKPGKLYKCNKTPVHSCFFLGSRVTSINGFVFQSNHMVRARRKNVTNIAMNAAVAAFSPSQNANATKAVHPASEVAA